MGMPAPVTRRQDIARSRNINSAESATTGWKAAANTGWDADIAGANPQFQHRFLLQEVGGGGWTNAREGIQFSINGGTWTTVGVSTAVQWRASSGYADGDDAVTQHLGSGTFNGVNDAMTENDFEGSSTIPDLDPNTEYEAEFALEIDVAAVNVTDTIRLRCQDNGLDLEEYNSASLFDITIINSAVRTRRFMSN